MSSQKGDRKVTESTEKYSSYSRFALLAVGVGSLLLMGNVSAATGPEADQNSSAPPSNELEEVVVTAQRRTQNLQDVPISAQVIGRQTLVQQDAFSLQTLSQTLPAVTVASSGRNTDMYIRGIGSGENSSFDQSVATFVDDVYYGRSRTTADTFLDLDHVEVLKGPQSTFFGNNAIAGALNIVTNKPTDTFDASARALYGSYGEYALEGAVGGAVSDKVDVRGAVIVNGMDGWITDLADGSHVPASQDKAGRLSVLLKPTSDLDVTLKVEGSTHTDNAGPYYQFFNCPPPPPYVASGFCKVDLALHVPSGLTSSYNDVAPGIGTRLNSAGAVLTANYHIADHTITSVTSYTGYQFNVNLQPDNGPVPMLTGQAPESYRQFSQELRLSSPVNRPIEYMVGAYLQPDHLNTDEEFGYYFLTPKLKTIAPFAPYLPLGQQVNFAQDEMSYSVFGSIAWNITDQLKLSGGLRAISNHKSYDWNLFYGTQTQPYGGIVPLPAAVGTLPDALRIGTVGALSGSRTDQALMPSAQLQYKVLPSAMVYFSYSKGFKAGGFNGADTSAVASRIPFKPEYVNSYEVGIKSKWFDNRVLINLDAFYMNYKDLQVANTIVQTDGAVIGLVNNAASSVSKGVEFEGQWLITPDIHLDADVTFLDAYYEQYPNASPDAMQQLQHQVVQNLSGRPTSYAPTWSGSVRGSYRAHLPHGLDLTTELSAYFTTSYFFGTGTDDPLISQRGYGRLDGRITLDLPDGRWAVDLLGKNLTDRVILADAFPMATSLGSVEGNRFEPRSVAVQARFRW